MTSLRMVGWNLVELGILYDGFHVYKDLSSQSDNYHVLKTHIDALRLVQFICLTQGICSFVTKC